MFTVVPVGRISTPFATRADCPRNGRAIQPPPLCTVTVFKEYREGLRDLDGFSHLILLYWMDQGSGPSLTIRPHFDGLPHGVFATRSPARPNPIALSVVAFEGFDDTGVLRVRNLDCIDGTPLIDIKPYLSRTDSEPDASLGWLAPHPVTRRT